MLEVISKIRSSKTWSGLLPALVVLSLILSPAALEASEEHQAPSLTVRLLNTTQGPLWPPSAIVDENGDFVVIGNFLAEVAPGLIVPIPSQAFLVSKETVPPLDADGKEDFSNPFAGAYTPIRPLDLSPGSPDLDMVLHANSFGPPIGDFGGGPRIPQLGESTYNLNGFPPVGSLCPEVFPAASQQFTFTRSSVPLHEVPILGFQGDQVAYDVDTGAAFTPTNKSGVFCPPQGCVGENEVDTRRTEPITLGDWLEADVRVTVTLTDFSEQAGGYTAAIFNIKAKNLLPDSMYTVVVTRTHALFALPIPKTPDPLDLPHVMVTDDKGRAELRRKIPNPFPDPAIDAEGLRVRGIAVGYRSDYQTWGACASRLGAGVDIHAVAGTFTDGTIDFTDFVTVSAP